METGIKIKSARNIHIEKIFKFLENLNIKSRKTEEFLDSIQEFYLEKGFLTDKQYEALLNIYERI